MSEIIKCNKCDLKVLRWFELTQPNKETLNLCGKCYNKNGWDGRGDEKQYWLNYGVIKEHGWKGQVVETETIKSCEHVDDDCYNCEACKKVVGVKHTSRERERERESKPSRKWNAPVATIRKIELKPMAFL